MAAFRKDRQRGIVVGFDTLESTWLMDLSFSLFLYNALIFLTGSEFDTQLGCRGEELLTLEAPNAVSEFRLLRPDGDTDTQKGEGGWLRYPRTDALGPYAISWDELDESGTRQTVERTLPVNLLAPGESDIAPRKELHIAGQSISAEDAPTRTHVRDLWPWLIALALMLLVGEWYYYHRR